MALLCSSRRERTPLGREGSSGVLCFLEVGLTRSSAGEARRIGRSPCGLCGQVGGRRARAGSEVKDDGAPATSRVEEPSRGLMTNQGLNARRNRSRPKQSKRHNGNAIIAAVGLWSGGHDDEVENPVAKDAA